MMSSQKVPPVFAMNVALNITKHPSSGGLFGGRAHPTSPNPRWIQVKEGQRKPRSTATTESRHYNPKNPLTSTDVFLTPSRALGADRKDI